MATLSQRDKNAKPCAMEDNVGNNLLALPGKATVKIKYKVYLNLCSNVDHPVEALPFLKVAYSVTCGTITN